jgi:hypothetical protein
VKILLGCGCGIVLMWGVVFPGLSQQAEFQRRQAKRESQGINGPAMFYTELEVLEKQTRLRNLRESDPWALWLPQFKPVE